MSGNNFADFLSQDRRLAILRILVEANGECGESVLEKVLRSLGHRIGVDRDALRADLRALETAGCIEIEFFQDKVMIAAITRRGVAAAEGSIKVDGVAVPAIGR